jgi:hypothetical protein
MSLSAGKRLGPYEILSVATARFARSRSRGANLLPPFGRETVRAANEGESAVEGHRLTEFG